MVERFRRLLLRYLRVPPEPEPPFGAPDSIRVFRAGANYYKLRLFVWMFKQSAAVVGLCFSIFVLHLTAGAVMHKARTGPTSGAAAHASAPAVSESAKPVPIPAKSSKTNIPTEDAARLREIIEKLVSRTTPERVRWVLLFLTLLEVAGVGVFCFQAVFSYAVLRLDYEMRWYVVTDRSLRIRSGILRVQELTMSFANLQQVILSQGPVQRLLGIADVKVESAGGGGMGPANQHGIEESLHTGFFHGVDNAVEVRDLILARLKRFRETGLGDPDDVHPEPPALGAAPQCGGDAVVAARALLSEVRGLRVSLAGKDGLIAG